MLRLLTFEWFGLHGLYWLISLAIPLILLLTTIIYLILNMRLAHKTSPRLNWLHQAISQLDHFGIDQLPVVTDLFEQTGQPALTAAMARLSRDSQVLYQDRWLPDLETELNMERLFSSPLRGSLSYHPSISIFLTGLLAGLVTALLQMEFPVVQEPLKLSLITLPITIALICSLFLAFQVQTIRKTIKTGLKDLRITIGRFLPVFSDHTGVALLVDSMLQYDHNMQQALAQFNETTEKLAQSDMAEGIRRSVEQVLQESIAPPIQKAAATLADLATELTTRQNQGMHELAAQFSAALTTEMVTQMAPVNRELTQMTTLMSDVRNYVDYAMRALETVRQQSDGLLKASQASLEQMATARDDLADDFSAVSDYIQQLSVTTEKMTALYQGQETALSTALQALSGQLELHSQSLGASLVETAKATQLAGSLTDLQRRSTDEYMQVMQNQYQQLDRVSQLLKTTMEQFIHDSGQYVQGTLKEFDQGLAELIERLSFTVTEIRDAVDALPAALRPGARFND